MFNQNKENSMEKAKTLLDSGEKYYQAEKYPIAKISFDSVLQIYREHHGLKHTETVTVLKKLIDVEQKLQNFEEAKVLLEELVSVHGDEDLKSVDAMLELSDVEKMLCRYDEAKKLVMKCLEMCEKKYQRKSVEVARILVSLSHIESIEDEVQAIKTLNEVVQIYKSICGEEDIRYGYALFNLGILQMNKKQYNASETSFNKAYDVRKKIKKCDDLETANILLNLCTVNTLQQKFSDANENISRAIDIFNEKYGKEDCRSVGLWINKSNIEIELRDYKNAKKSLEFVQKEFEKLFGPEHINTAHVLLNLSTVEIQCNNLVNLKKILDRVLKVYEKYYEKNNIKIFNVRLSLCKCEKSLWNYGTAEKLLDQIFKYETTNLSKNITEITCLMSRVKLNLGKHDEAKKLLENNQNINIKFLETANILLNLSAVERELRNYNKSIDKLQEILLNCKRSSELEADIKMNMSNIEVDREKYEIAKKLVEEAIKIYENKAIKKCADANLNLSNIEKYLGDYTSSKKHLEIALIKYKKEYGPRSIKTARAMLNMNNIKFDLGEYDKNGIEDIISIFKECYGSDHIEVARIQLNLSNIEIEMGISEIAKTNLEIFSKTYDPKNLDTLKPEDMIDGENRSKNFNEADRLLKHILPIYEKYYGSKHHKTAGVLLSISNLKLALEDYKEAMKSLEKILPLFQNYFGTYHTETSGVHFSMSIAEYGKKNYPKAKEHIDIVFKTYKEVNDNEVHKRPLYFKAKFHLAKIERGLGNYEVAESLLEEVSHLYEIFYGLQHLNVKIILLYIYQTCRDSKKKFRVGDRLKTSLETTQ